MSSGLIGAGVKGIAGIGGAIAGARAAHKRDAMLRQQQADNQHWYDRRYNEDGTQRADAQAALTRMREQMQRRQQSAAGSQAVMGASAESAAAEKQAENQALGNTISNIDVSQEARKDNIENSYRSQKAALTQRQAAYKDAERSEIADSASQLGGVAKDIGSNAVDYFSALNKKAK